MYSNKKLKYLDNNEKVTYLKQKFNKKIKMIKKITISKKSLRLIKMSNTIIFETYSILNKNYVKKSINTLFDYKIEKINSLIGKKGYKKYFIKIDKRYSATDIVSCLGFKLI